MMGNIIQNPINHYGMTKSFIYYRNSTEHCTFLTVTVIEMYIYYLSTISLFSIDQFTEYSSSDRHFGFYLTKIKTIVIEMLTIKKPIGNMLFLFD